ncbi:MAG: hypothetical protein ACRC8A_14180 [Microcoleaceae cyanobacterium]
MSSPSSPQYWGSRISQSPSVLGDLGGEETTQINTDFDSATPPD